jgi:hypothetical protein
MYSNEGVVAHIAPSAKKHTESTIKKFQEISTAEIPISMVLLLQQSKNPIGDLENLKTELSKIKDHKFLTFIKELDNALEILHQYPNRQSGLRNSVDASEIQEWAKKVINELKTKEQIYAPNAPMTDGVATNAYIYLNGGLSSHVMGGSKAQNLITQILKLSEQTDIEYPKLILELATALGDIKTEDHEVVLKALSGLTPSTESDAIRAWLYEFVDIKKLFLGSKNSIGMMQLGFTMAGFIFFLASVVALDAKLSFISIAPIQYGFMLITIFAFLSAYLSPGKGEKNQQFNQLVNGYFTMYLLLYMSFVFRIELLSTLGRSIGFFRNQFLVNWTKVSSHFFNPIKQMLVSPAANTLVNDAASMGM